MTDTPWLDEARKYIGLKEIVGSKNEKEIVRFFADAGHPEIHDDETAWCAAFVGAMLRRSGYRSTGSLMARSYERFGKELDKPEQGCLIVMKRGSGWQGHVGFYDNGKILAGNQGNAVSRINYDKSKVVAYRMPTEKVKPLIESKITQAGGAIIAAETGDAINTAKEAADKVNDVKGITDQIGITDHIMSVITNPRFLLAIVVIIAVAVIIYWRWRDHGRGSGEKGVLPEQES